MENPPSKYFRLFKGNEVRLKGAYFIKIIHRINTPLITRIMVNRMRNSIYYRISHINIARRHIYLYQDK